MKRTQLAVAFMLLAVLAGLAAAQERYEWREGHWVRLAAPAMGTPEGEAAMMRLYIDQGKNEQAVTLAQAFSKRFGAQEEAQEVYYLAGMAEYNRGRYFQAYEWFEKQLNQFPAGFWSDRGLNREFDVAEQFLAGKKRVAMGIFKLPAYDEAVEILNRVAEHAPGTPMAERALLRVGDWYFSKARWNDAVLGYDAYLKLMPKGDKVPYAMLQAARASFADYRGPEHDDTPLLNSEQRFTTFRETYPSEARRQNVSQSLEQIRWAKSERDYTTANFYQRTDRLPAAAYYYEWVAEQYPRTPWADRAKTDLIAVKPMAKTPAQVALAKANQPVQPESTVVIKPSASPAATTQSVVVVGSSTTRPASRTSAASQPAESNSRMQLEKLLPNGKEGRK